MEATMETSYEPKETVRAIISISKYNRESIILNKGKEVSAKVWFEGDELKAIITKTKTF